MIDYPMNPLILLTISVLADIRSRQLFQFPREVLSLPRHQQELLITVIKCTNVQNLSVIDKQGNSISSEL